MFKSYKIIVMSLLLSMTFGIEAKELYNNILQQCFEFLFPVTRPNFTAGELVDRYFEQHPEKKAMIDAMESSHGSYKKIVAITLAVGVLSYAAYCGYKSYCYVPSFESLVQQYLYETEDVDIHIIQRKFYGALQKYGYTSLQDKQRAQQLLYDFEILI